LGCEERISNGRCGGVFEVDRCEIKLAFANPMDCSIPEIVVAALVNRLKPSMTFVRDLMFRWSCSISFGAKYGRERKTAYTP
jgi:hypothetical protein